MGKLHRQGEGSRPLVWRHQWPGEIPFLDKSGRGKSRTAVWHAYWPTSHPKSRSQSGETWGRSPDMHGADSQTHSGNKFAAFSGQGLPLDTTVEVNAVSPATAILAVERTHENQPRAYAPGQS